MNVCMLAYSFYEFDNRIRRYAEALAARGDHVDVIALCWDADAPVGECNGVHIFRIQKRPLNKISKIEYLARLTLFLIRSMFLISWKHLQDPYDLVHVHSVPDFEVFAAWFPKSTGAKLILDVHDIVPEFYAEKFHRSHDTLVFKLLVFVERLSAAFANHVIVANHIWQDRLAQRSVKSSKLTTFLNYPDGAFLVRPPRTRKDGKVILMYPGTLAYHQGLDIAIRAFARIRNEVPEAEFHIYGTGDQYSVLENLICELCLQQRVFLKGVLHSNQIVSAIADSDIGVVPKRKDGFGNEAFSTKILEFMALGVPVIISDTLIDAYYFDNSVARFFHGNDEKSLASAMLDLIKNQGARQTLVQNADQFIKKFLWDSNKDRYLALVDSLSTSPK